MHIVIISDFETKGGANIATSRLATALALSGIQVTRIVYQKDKIKHGWETHTLKVFGDICLRISETILQTPSTTIRHSLIYKKLDHLLEKLKPDIINIHNIHGAHWSPLIAKICSNHAPVAWTLHDMWSFTGSCAYSYNCRKFIAGCDSECPETGTYPTLKPKLIRRAWEERKELLETHLDLTAVSPSNWLAKQASFGLWKNHQIKVIPNSLPLKIFKPKNKNESRKALGIRTNSPILLAVAQDLNDKRKGYDILIKALQRVEIRPLTLITMGKGRIRQIANSDDRINLYSLGYLRDEQTKSLVYNASNLLIHPALIDNLPNTIMEAIACGTPVVAFATGGVPELVRPRKTGWLAEEVSSKALAKAIEFALNEIHQGLDLQDSCRKIAEDEYSYEQQSQKYLKLFESLVQ